MYLLFIIVAKKLLHLHIFFIDYLPTWIYCLISHVQNISIEFIVQSKIVIPTVFLLVQ